MANGTRKPMRQGQQNRRGRGRGRKPQNPASRNLESNGPEVKIRGTASHIAEKYTALARDAQVSGDSVASENYFQHAEHYNRIIMANQAQQQAAAAAQGEGMNGSVRNRPNNAPDGNGRAQPEAAPAAVQSDNSAGDNEDANNIVADAAAEQTVASNDAPSNAAPSEETGNDEGLARMMARSTTGSGNGADKEKQPKADKESKPAKAAKPAKTSKKESDSDSDDTSADDAPDEAVT